MEAYSVAQNATVQAATGKNLILVTITGAVWWMHEVQSRLDERHASGRVAGLSENPQSDACGAETRPGCRDVRCHHSAPDFRGAPLVSGGKRSRSIPACHSAAARS